MHVLSMTWVLNIKPVDSDRTKCFSKAFCCDRRENQIADVEYDPFGIHAPVAFHNAVRFLLDYAAAYGLHVAEGDVARA